MPEFTELNVDKLYELLLNLDRMERHFIGRALIDQHMTVIHHYDKPGMPYPDFSAGFLISWPVLVSSGGNIPDFSIDPKYEVSRVHCDVLYLR